MIQNKLLLLLIALFWQIGGGTVFGQCPNSYTINTQNQPSCATANNGSLTLTGTTFYSSSTFLWSNGSTSRNLNNVAAGSYSVTVTDPTNCSYTAITYLGASPTGLVVSTSFDLCNTSLSANISGLYTYPLTYSWSDGSTQQSIQNPAPGVYSVILTDGGGCTGQASITVLPYNTKISATHTDLPASCNASNGSIDLTVSGGTPPYTYYWYSGAQGQTVEDPSNVPVGLSRVRIIDANNCSFFYDVNVSGPQVDLTKANMSCGLVNGSITAATQSMTNPTFVWSNGGTGATISGLSTGTYTVTVTDGSCTIIKSATISNGGNVSVYIADSVGYNCSITELHAFCYGGAGSGYTYLWNTGETTASIIAMQTGLNTYDVTVTDANGCSATATIQANGLGGGLNFSSVVTDATCGNSDGAIDLTAPGANNFLWNPTGAITEDIAGIAAGFHIVRARNWSGCFYSDTIPVGEFIEFTSRNASCGLSNGSASVYDYGMTNPTFAWNTGATVPTINNLAAGMYVVTVTNGSCVIIDSVEILDAGQIVAGITPTSTCQPDYLIAIPTDGATPYTYLWDNGTADQGLSSPIPGNMYYVTITDANGCFDSASYLVPNPPLITASYTVIDATCGNKNGAIDLTLTGGTMPYNYAWSYGSANVEDLNGIFPSQYAVRIEDNNGCILELNNIVVGGQTNHGISAATTPPNSTGTGGAIDLTITGVSNPTFVWSTGATTEDISNLSFGRYRVSVTDPATGCVVVRIYILSQTTVSNPSTRTLIHGGVYDVSATGSCQGGQGRVAQQYKMVRLQPSGRITFTDRHGRYEFYVNAPGNYLVEYINTSSTTTVLCPTGGTVAVNNVVLGSSYNNNFYLINPPAQDVKIDLWDWSNATPGFSYYTRVSYCNAGNTIINGNVEYDYNSLLGFESISGWGSTLTFHDIPGHKFYWSFNNLYPSSCRSLDVRFRVPPTTALGTALLGTADALPIIGDVTPANNTNGEYTTVVGSWDPNDKQVEPYHSGDAWNGGIIYTTDEELEYTIRFQNTGTAPANFVIIRDTLDVNLLPETVREIKTRHDAEVSLEDGNILVFTFDNIYLPDSTTDFDASMGFVKFKINRVAGLPIGTEIENTAAIYFDYNVPVITNTPISIIDQFTSVVDIDGNEFTVETMPNPFERGITLKYTLEETSEVTIRVMNSMGQCVYTHVTNATQNEGVYVEQLNMENLPSGMYLLNVETSKAMTTTKIVKR